MFRTVPDGSGRFRTVPNIIINVIINTNVIIIAINILISLYKKRNSVI